MPVLWQSALDQVLLLHRRWRRRLAQIRFVSGSVQRPCLPLHHAEELQQSTRRLGPFQPLLKQPLLGAECTVPQIFVVGLDVPGSLFHRPERTGRGSFLAIESGTGLLRPEVQYEQERLNGATAGLW